MAKKRTASKKRSLPEFRAWLQGVEELQPADWAPNADQWKLIRKSIDNIVDEEPQVIERNVRSAVPAYVAPHAPGMPTHMAPPGSATAPVGVPPIPTVESSGLPADAVVEMSEEAKKLLAGSAPSAPGAPRKTVTPNIDTADGNYASSFE